jgi:hypothetical protein
MSFALPGQAARDMSMILQYNTFISKFDFQFIFIFIYYQLPLTVQVLLSACAAGLDATLHLLQPLRDGGTHALGQAVDERHLAHLGVEVS